MLAISARIAATNSLSLNIKTVSSFRGDIVFSSLDKETKISQIKKFIEKEYKVKISLRLSGREKLHAESAVKILDAFADSFEETAIVEKKYGKEQVQKFVMLSPKK